MIKRGSKKTILYVFSSFCAVITVCLTFYLLRHLPKVPYTLADWRSRQAVKSNNGLSIDEELKNTGVSSVFLWGPYEPLKRGSYTANISYSADEDQVVAATASDEIADFISASKGTLSHHFHSLAYQFELTENVDEFQIYFYYSGSGEFTVHSISIVPNGNQLKRTAVVILAALAMLNLVPLLWERSVDEKKTILALAGITALISLPLWIFGIHNGDDLQVQFLRIEAILQALRSGQFPARISSITLFGLGYPFSIYENDLFLYFPALLRLTGFSVISAYKIYVSAVNLGTVLISYYSFKHIFKNRSIGLLLTLLYASSPFRMMSVYFRAAVGEYTGQTFLPLLALAVYRICFEKNGSFRKGFCNAFLMTAAMSGIIGSDLPSAITAGLMALLLCLICGRKSTLRITFLTFFCAVGLTLLVNLYFLVPFTDYSLRIPVKLPEYFRFTWPGLLLLVLFVGFILRKSKKSFVIIISAVFVFAAIWGVCKMFENSHIIYIYATSGVSPEWISHGTYLMNGSSTENIRTEITGNYLRSAEVLERKSNLMRLACTTENGMGDVIVDVPIYNYPGYHVTDTAGREYPVVSGEENHINFVLPGGFDGIITIEFRDPVYWRIALWVSIVSAAVFALSLVRRRVRLLVSSRAR